MAKDLIIVESPAKVKTIKKFLGKDYQVEASVGHVRDLPAKDLGVDEDKDFAPKYQVIPGKQKVVTALKAAAEKADHVYLAPDPDREGEAIAWHVAELIKGKNTNVSRIQFNEITSRAVREALEHPRELNEPLFHSQQARRILDRLVGYKISPLLWQKVKRGISAGRVQSVALRLIVDREKERQAFRPEEYWVFKALLSPADSGAEPAEGGRFEAELSKIGGKKARVGSAAEAEALESRVRAADFAVASVEEKERSRSPMPPFITSTLQQESSRRLGYSAKKTMSTAQRLYEGVDLGDKGTTALITYMRTDSVRIADEARDAAHAYIVGTLGKDYYPPKPRVFKTKASAQDAHEAIRPVDVAVTPDQVRGLLPSDQFRLYKLIWERFVASQMAAARFWDTVVLARAADTEWRAKGERLIFPGFLKVYGKVAEEDEAEAGSASLPKLAADQPLALDELKKDQKFTQPPPRFSEASLVRELEEKGIGRPSTYAAIISTLIDRDYARLEEKHFVPSELGTTVSDLLSAHFVKLMDIGFTAEMEQSLDQVADGKQNWVELLKTFTGDFYPTLDLAKTGMAQVKAGKETDVACETCGKPMVIKFGKTGEFLGCSGYPACGNTRNFTRDENGAIVVQDKQDNGAAKIGRTCPDCGKELVLKKSRTGSRFISCEGWPECKHTEPFPTGVDCPREGCTGRLVEKSSKRGKVFYSCDSYPKCDFALWDWPVPGPCPTCKSPLLVRKTRRGGGEVVTCPVKGCGYVQAGEDAED